MKFIVGLTANGKQYLVCRQDPQDPTVIHVVYGYAFDQQVDAERWARILNSAYADGVEDGFQAGLLE